MIQLSDNELRVFKACAQIPSRQSRIAKSIGISAAGVSQIASRLVEGGFCSRGEDGLGITISEHAVALSSALQDAVIPEWALIGGNLPILLSLMGAGKPVARVALETGLAPSTLHIYERRMREQAMTVLEEDLHLAPGNKALGAFLSSYSHGCALHLAGRYDRAARLVWNDGLQFIIRSNKEGLDGSLKTTGLDYMALHGLEVGGSYRTYHRSFWNGENGVELACTHAHLNEPDSSTAITYCILTLMKNPFDRRKLLEEARYAGVERIMDKVARVARGDYVRDRMIIPESELREIGRRYGVGP